MAKTLTEMAADIVKAQAGVTRMSAEELSEVLTRTYDSLRRVKSLEEGPVVGMAASEAATVAVEPKASIQRSKIVCLECGKDYKQLSRSHLKSHGLTPKDYKKKHGLKASQALTAKSLSAKRRKAAKERGLGEKLAAARRRLKRK